MIATYPPRLLHAFTLDVLLAEERDHGSGPWGRRLHVSILGGTVQGPQLQGRILPGGADWQLQRADHCLELLAHYDIEAADGSLIHVRNQGLWFSRSGDWPADYAMSQPCFQAPEGPHAWLNQHQFLAQVQQSGDARCPAVRLPVYQVLMPDTGHTLSA